MNGKRAWLLVAALAVAGSQAGHLLAYQLRFGAAAQSMQSAGVHGYFPGVLKTSLGLAGVAALYGLFAIGLARTVNGRAVRGGTAPEYLRILAALYTAQLAFFAAQEVVESLVAGGPVSSAANVLLWGTLGQLPVALVAAAALRWLLVRVEPALAIIGVAHAARPDLPLPTGPILTVWPPSQPLPFLASGVAQSPARRGPPSSWRLSFN